MILLNKPRFNFKYLKFKITNLTYGNILKSLDFTSNKVNFFLPLSLLLAVVDEMQRLADIEMTEKFEHKRSALPKK